MVGKRPESLNESLSSVVNKVLMPLALPGLGQMALLKASEPITRWENRP